MLTSRRILAIAAALTLCGTTPVWAQSNSLFGTSGATSATPSVGGSSFGSTSSSRSTGGGGGGGGTSMLDQLGGQSGFGQGGAKGGQMSFGFGQSLDQLGQFNSGGQQSAFTGRSDSAGRFVGSSQAGEQTSTATGQGGRGGAGAGRGAGQLGRNAAGGGQVGNFGGLNVQGFGRGGQGGQGTQQRRPAPIRQRIAFDFTRAPTAVVATTVTTRFASFETRPEFQGIQAEVSGTSLILRGEVASEDAKKLATILAKFEPGVSGVQNELVVKPK